MQGSCFLNTHIQKYLQHLATTKYWPVVPVVEIFVESFHKGPTTVTLTAPSAGQPEGTEASVATVRVATLNDWQ